MPLTSPSMHGDSFMAPQQPRKPTTIMRAPAAIRMYTPGRHTRSQLLKHATLLIFFFTFALKTAAHSHSCVQTFFKNQQASSPTVRAYKQSHKFKFSSHQLKPRIYLNVVLRAAAHITQLEGQQNYQLTVKADVTKAA